MKPRRNSSGRFVPAGRRSRKNDAGKPWAVVGHGQLKQKFDTKAEAQAWIDGITGIGPETRRKYHVVRSSSLVKGKGNPLVVPPALLAEYGGPIIRTAGQELQVIPKGFKFLPNSRRRKAARTVAAGGARPPKKTGKSGKNRSRNNTGTRRNPLDAAQEVYREFHGRESAETVEVTTRLHEHKYLSGIGELEKLVLVSPAGYEVTVSGFAGSLLCQNEKRTQLFIEGGDQSVDVADFGIRDPIHETEVLGELLQVWYYTIKDHLGDEGGEAIYRHKLKNYRFRRRPTMIYDTVNKLISFAGGNYSIPDEGIKD